MKKLTIHLYSLKQKSINIVSKGMQANIANFTVKCQTHTSIGFYATQTRARSIDRGSRPGVCVPAGVHEKSLGV